MPLSQVTLPSPRAVKGAGKGVSQEGGGPCGFSAFGWADTACRALRTACVGLLADKPSCLDYVAPLLLGVLRHVRGALQGTHPRFLRGLASPPLTSNGPQTFCAACYPGPSRLLPIRLRSGGGPHRVLQPGLPASDPPPHQKGQGLPMGRADTDRNSIWEQQRALKIFHSRLCFISQA